MGTSLDTEWPVGRAPDVSAYGRGRRCAARLRSWVPTVAPIWASSPTAWTAVVTISVPLGRPLAGRGGGGGGVGRWAAVAFGCVAAAGDFVAAFVFAFLGFAAGDRVVFGFAAVARDAVAPARRSPPMRVGRVDRRLPRTLGLAPAFADFFDFFLADFCVMDTVIGRRGRLPL
jgi:hypothetical protein